MCASNIVCIRLWELDELPTVLLISPLAATRGEKALSQDAFCTLIPLVTP